MMRPPADSWPPSRYRQITAIDSHTAGEPFRVITGGFPELSGSTILEYRRDARERFDSLRKALMWEPRGHADMYGCLLTPPESEDGDFGILFLHNEGYSTMCGHGIIAISTVVLETGMLPAETPETVLRIDSPAGRVTAHVRVQVDGDQIRVPRVRFQNVPSFVVELDAEVEVEGLGTVRYDLAYGGAFYAYVDAAEVGVGLDGDHFRQLIDLGSRIKAAVMASRKIEHPFEPDLGFLYGVIFTGPAVETPVEPGRIPSRNVCIFADGEVDRSPTGTGVSGRVAIHHARGELGDGQYLDVESILGTRFTGRVDARVPFGPYEAVIPEVTGRASITGQHRFLIDPDDELKHGFILR